MIIGCVPTMPSRKNILPRMVESVKGQLDVLNICLNTPDNDLGATGRYKFCPKEGSHYYFTMDDDLVYPPDYVQNTIKAIEKYKRRAAVAYHGRILTKFPMTRWSVDSVTYPCLEDVKNDTWAHVLGTGVMAFHTDTIRIFPDQFKELINDDVEAAIILQKAGVPMVVLAHKADYFKYLNPPIESTIWYRDCQTREARKTQIAADYTDWKIRKV